MAKKTKEGRIIITLECTEARGKGLTPSRYSTMKNRKNTTERLELMKYNRFMKKYTLHREVR
ncbi:50S ribosomal protein L33 [bacterium]|nr:50S ribosomal protein L33 [bacterium]